MTRLALFYLAYAKNWPPTFKTKNSPPARQICPLWGKLPLPQIRLSHGNISEKRQQKQGKNKVIILVQFPPN